MNKNGIKFNKIKHFQENMRIRQNQIKGIYLQNVYESYESKEKDIMTIMEIRE